MTAVADPLRQGPTPPAFDPSDPPVLGANPFVGLTRRQLGAALGRLVGRVAIEPGAVVTGGVEAARQLGQVARGRSDVARAPADKRFADPAWSSNPFYRRLLQAYLVDATPCSGWSTRWASTPRAAAGATSRFRSSPRLPPPPTRCSATRAAGQGVADVGQSLVAGLRHFRHDLRHNGGMPSMVDPRPFEVGVNLAVTPGEVIHRSELFELIQYRPRSGPTGARSSLFRRRSTSTTSPTSRRAGASSSTPSPPASPTSRSAGATPPRQRDWDLAAYVSACKEAIAVACDVSATDDANVAGMCAGGITLACLLGHLAATDEPLVNSATFMVAGLDISEESTVGLLTSGRPSKRPALRSQRRGVLDGRDLGRMFAWLRPNDLVWNYWVNNYLLGQNPPAFDILYWNADTTNLPAGLHSDFLDLLGSNGLARPDPSRCSARPSTSATSGATPTWRRAPPTTSSRGRPPIKPRRCSAATPSSCWAPAATSRRS